MKYVFERTVYRQGGGKFHFRRTVLANSEANAQSIFAIELYQKCRAVGARYVFPFGEGTKGNQ